jgi:hypothetical protein
VETASAWLDRLLHRPGSDVWEAFAVMQLARKTGDRYRDVSDDVRERVLKWMDRLQAPRTMRKLVREGGLLEAEDQGMVFGESLPRGLRIM